MTFLLYEWFEDDDDDDDGDPWYELYDDDAAADEFYNPYDDLYDDAEDTEADQQDY